MNQEQIVLVARLKVKPETVGEIKNAALRLATDSRAEPGCLNYDVHQGLEDETIFVWHETWANKAALDGHFAKPYFAQFLAQAERAAAEPPQMDLTRMITERSQKK